MRLVGGRYELGEEIGRGGMAQVHAAYDTRLGRRVAVKMLHAGRVGDRIFLARFRREAQAAAGLTHPNIVAVYDSGEDLVETPNGKELVPFIVMELVQGRTLSQIMHDDGTLTIDQALKVTEGVLAALGYSHAHGVVHRDIKPGNVMLTPSGDVKVMDFGIARGGAGDATATMTQTQSVVGTAQYLSPEQARGLDVDGRSDLYSAGCLLFELVTGRPPFVGDSPLAIAYQHVGEDPATPSTYNPAISHELDAVILHALIKDRDRRYQDAAAFAADVCAVREGHPLSPAARATEDATFAPTQAISRTDERPAVATAAGAGAAAAGAAAASAPADEADAMVAGGAGATAAAPPTRAQAREQERRSPWRWLLPLLLALVAVGAALWWFTRPPAVVTKPVPRLIDKTEDQARAALSAVGLQGTFTYAANSRPAGIVYGQDPAQGTQQDITRAVAVEVSKGPANAKVPEVRSMLQASAKSSLQAVGLKVARVVQVDSATVPADSVVKTDPAAGTTVPTGSGITLFVSTGKVTVPDVRGMKKEDAATTLQKAGFGVGYEVAQTADAAPDTVLSQDPQGGAVAPGTKVMLTIVAPPPAPTVTTTVTTTSAPTPTPTPTQTPTQEPTVETRPTDPPTTSQPTTPAPTSTTATPEPTTPQP